MGLLLLLLLFYLPTPYHLLKPGLALPLTETILIEGESYRPQGEILLTSVASERATPFDIISQLLLPQEGVELVHLGRQLPPGVEMEEYLQLMQELMEESKMKAKVVALSRVGEEAEISGGGAEVVEIMDQSRAQGLLHTGDVITAADGRTLQLATELVQLVEDREIGEAVNLQVLDNEGQAREVEVKTREFGDRPGKASIGILIRSYQLEYDFSRQIEIRTQRIVGPSAGLMFTLEIINQLTPEDLTGGRRLAGTGTIDLEGEVGPIDGVQQKILAAHRERAEFFILPYKNLEQVEGWDSPLELIPVKNIQQLLELLENDRLSQKVFSPQPVFSLPVGQAV